MTGLFWHLNREVYAAASTTHVAVHAAVVEADGRAILMPGRSGAGKSTLAARLVTGGLRYGTDELAFVRPESLCIEPYPKPISLEPGSWPRFARLEPPALPGPPEQESAWQVSPDRAGTVSTSARPIGSVVFPEYAPTNGNECEPLTPMTALGLLAQNVFDVRAHPSTLRVLRRIAETVPCSRLRFNDVDWAHARICGGAGRS